MHRALAIGISLLAFGPLAAESRADSKLEQVRSEVRTPPDDSGQDHQDGHDGHCCNDDGDSWAGALLAPLVEPMVWGLTSPFWLPPAVLQDHYDFEACFTHFPYQDGCDGYLQIPRMDAAATQMWSGQLAGDVGTDLDDLTRFHTRCLLELGPSRLGIDSETSYLREETALGADHLWLGDFNLVFRFAQSPRLAMRTGLGVNWLADDRGNDTGINFTYGGDWFPVNPLVVSAHCDLGKLGHASLVHAEATVGVQWHGVEVYTGYDFLLIGSANNHFALGGVRFWF